MFSETGVSCTKMYLFFVFLCEFMAQEIGKVEFRQEGNFQFPVAVLRDNVQTKKGLMFSERILNDDVRRLYALGVFADVVTMVETLPDGKKAVTFRVSAKPVVTAVIFEGNRKYTNEKLREFVKIFPGSPLNEKLLSEIIKMTTDGARYELTESVEFNPGWTYEEYEANPTKYEIEFEKIREEAKSIVAEYYKSKENQNS